MSFFLNEGYLSNLIWLQMVIIKIRWAKTWRLLYWWIVINLFGTIFVYVKIVKFVNATTTPHRFCCSSLQPPLYKPCMHCCLVESFWTLLPLMRSDVYWTSTGYLCCKADGQLLKDKKGKNRDVDSWVRNHAKYFGSSHCCIWCQGMFIHDVC